MSAIYEGQTGASFDVLIAECDATVSSTIQAIALSGGGMSIPGD